MAASSNFWFLPYFYFRFGRKQLSGGVSGDFCLLLCKISRLWTVRVLLDVDRRLMTSFPVLLRPEVVSSGQTVAARSIYCIEVEQEVGYCEFVYAVSAIFLFPVWPEMTVSGLFLPVMRLLHRVVARRLAQSATDVNRRPEYYFRFNRKLTLDVACHGSSFLNITESIWTLICLV